MEARKPPVVSEGEEDDVWNQLKEADPILYKALDKKLRALEDKLAGEAERKVQEKLQPIEYERHEAFVQAQLGALEPTVPNWREVTSDPYWKMWLDSQTPGTQAMFNALERVMFGQFKVMEEKAILQFYLESGQEYFHLGMDTHYELWKKTGEQQYLKSFIQYSDKNKNSLMYRDIQMASNLFALSEEMIQKEFELRAVLKGEKRKGMRSNKAFNRYMDEYTRLENKISTLNRSFISHGLQKEPINIKTFQQTMDEEMSILIIDETQEYWYYTLISRNKIILDRQKITPD